MPPPKRLRVHVAAFDPNLKNRHGGVRRASQLCAISGADLTCVVPPIGAVPVSQLIRYIARGLFSLRRSGLSPKALLKAAFAVGYVQEELSRKGAAAHEVTFLVELCRGSSMYIAYWLALQRYDFSVAPNNIEFLVPNRSGVPGSDSMLYLMEGTIYERARRVACISDIDAFVARTFGARALTVPYHPVESDLPRFDKIRDARSAGAADFELLFVGTVHNPPTMKGLERLLRDFKRAFDERWSLRVVGYGTERVSALAEPGLTVEGAVSDERLDALLTRCTAILLYQPATTGFLTRLVEMNLCGIPSFVNEEYLPAAGFERYGIRTYRDLSDVHAMIAENRREPFDTLKAPCIDLGQALWVDAEEGSSSPR